MTIQQGNFFKINRLQTLFQMPPAQYRGRDVCPNSQPLPLARIFYHLQTHGYFPRRENLRTLAFNDIFFHSKFLQASPWTVPTTVVSLILGLMTYLLVVFLF